METDNDNSGTISPSKRVDLEFIRRVSRWVIGTLATVFILIQFIPISKTNPPVDGEILASPEVMSILRRACFDCHSNETRWPWYSTIAPVSWLTVKDVNEGREHLNFSIWNGYNTETQRENREEVWEEVEEGEMPLWFYTPLHREAKLSANDKDVLRSWATQSGQIPKAGGKRHDHDEDE